MNELEERQSFLNSIYEGADLPMFVISVDRDNEFVFEGINAAHERLTGLDNKEVKGKTPEQLPGIPSEAKAVIRENYEQCIRAAKPIQYKEMIPINNKETHWLTTLTPLKNEHGRIYRIVGTAMFINQLIETQRELEYHKKQLEQLVDKRTKTGVESELRFKAIFESTGDCIMVWDKSNRCKYANQSTLKMLEVAADQIIDRKMDVSLGHLPDFVRVWENRIEKLFRTGERFRVEDNDLINGKKVYSESVISPIRDSENNIIAAGVVYRDVTARTEAIMSQQETSEKYRFITEATNHGIWDWNVVSNEVYYSPQWKEQIGYKEADLANTFKTWEDRIHPEDQERSIHALNAYLKKPQGKIVLEFRFRHKKGHYIWIHNEASSKLDKHGKVVQMFGVHTDITKRKKAEESLRQSENNLKLLLDSMPFGSVIIGQDRKIRSANQAALRMMGFNSADKVIGATCYSTFCPSCADNCPVWDQKQELSMKDMVLVSKENKVIPILKSAVEIILDDEKVLLETFVDISDLKKMELDKDSALLELNERIKEIQCLYQVNEQFRGNSKDSRHLLQQSVDLIPKGWRFPEMTTAQIIFDEIEVWSTGKPKIRGRYIEKDIHIGNSIRGSIRIYVDTSAIEKIAKDKDVFLSEEKQLLNEIASSIGQHISKKEYEIALVENETKFRNLFDNSPLPKAIADFENNIEAINMSFTEKIGYLSEDIPTLEKWWSIAYPDPSYRKKIKSNWNKALRQAIESNQPTVRVESKVHCKNDTERTVEMIGHKIGDKLLLVFNDLTERIKAEEERDRFFTVSLDLLCIATTDGYFKRMNPSWQNTLGWSLEELQSRPFIDFVHPDDVEATINEVKKLAAGIPTVSFTNRYRCKNGNYRWLNWNTTPFGDVLYAAATDITELVLATKELQRSNQELEQFAYVASHDLQQPLRMVSSYTQLLEKKYKDQLDDKADKYIHYAVDGARRMQELINDLLDYSRITTNGEDFKETDVNILIQSVLNKLVIRMKETDASIKTEPMPSIVCAPSQISRVFQNLIENALKFTHERKPEISISLQKDKNEWIFSVKDNGIGIDPKFKEKIFVIFQRLHHRDEFPGSGIGLSICKRIVNRHGGNIWFDSEMGKGTTFYFNIPKNLNKNIKNGEN